MAGDKACLNRGWHFPATLLLSSALLLTGCDQPAPGPGTAVSDDREVLARVGDRAITVADFSRELTRRAQTHPQLYASEAQHRKLLEEMIQFEVLLASALIG